MNRRFLIDAAERVVFTFLEAFAGAIVLAGALDLSTAKAAAIAGVTAAAAVVKSLAAKFVGRADSAAVLPVAVDPAPLGEIAMRARQFPVTEVRDAFEPSTPIKAHPKKVGGYESSARTPSDLKPPRPGPAPGAKKAATKKAK